MAKHSDVQHRRSHVKTLAMDVTHKGRHKWPTYSGAPAICIALKRLHNIDASTSTVQRDLRACGFRSLVRRKVPTMDSKVHAKRLRFARRLKRQHAHDICFSDEHWVSTNDHTCRRQWVSHKRFLLCRERKRLHNTGHAQVWACVGRNYKSPLVILEPCVRLNNVLYKTLCLGKVLSSLRGRTFQHDGARAHAHSTVKPFIEAHGVYLLEDWPPYSPDLSPIEEMWPLLNRGIAERGPVTVAELHKAAHEAWNAIPMHVVNKFVSSFDVKLTTCIQHKGTCKFL